MGSFIRIPYESWQEFARLFPAFFSGSLANAVSFDGVVPGDSDAVIHYCVCNTEMDVAAKAGSCDGFTLETGSRIVVKFTNTNTETNPTLNISDTGAKPIYYKGQAIPPEYLAANYTLEFVYNGTQYELIGGIGSSATYSEATTSAAGLMSASDKTKLDGIATGAQVNTVTGVKGDSENSYRTGNINITKANIGLGNVDNTADESKSVSYAASAGDAATVSGFTVGKSVPSNAVFTDTTYSNATSLAGGLMSAADKAKLDGVTASADAVSFTPSLTSGTKVGTITINGTGTDLYCQTNTNTDTLMTQNVSTTDSTYPVLLCPTADATANQGAKTGIFGSGVKVNPSTRAIIAKCTELFGGSSSNNGGFVDFHYNGSSSDFTSRIIESASGTIDINGVKLSNSTVTGNVTGNVSGSSGSCTGNAATATKINGKTILTVNSFDSSTGTLTLTSLS